MHPGNSTALHLCLKRIVTFYGACSNLPLRLVAREVHAFPFAHRWIAFTIATGSRTLLPRLARSDHRRLILCRKFWAQLQG